MKKQSKYSRFDRVYVDFPQFAEIRKFICIRDRCIYINTAAPVNGAVVKVLEMFAPGNGPI